MKGSLTIGKVAGIRIAIHWTFVLLILYVVIARYREGADSMQIFWSVALVMSVFVTVVLHELGHALTGKIFHISTKDITLLPIGGVARMERIPEKPGEELAVAIAGPLVNLLIAALTLFFVSIKDVLIFIREPDMIIGSDNFLYNFFAVNVFLFVFNLIPAFPMDGGRVLRALLTFTSNRKTATVIAARIGQLLAAGFVILGFYQNPFLIFIGLFIMFGAQSELEMVTTGFILKGRIIGDAVLRNYEQIHSTDTVNHAVQKLLDGTSKTFLVTENGLPIGVLGRSQIIRALAEGKNETQVKEIMNAHLLSFDHKTPIVDVMQQLNEGAHEMVLITREGKFIGVVDAENILEYVMVIAADSRAK